MSGIVPPAVHVEDSGSARGRGVFAARDFRAGELVETTPVVLIETAVEQLPPAMQRMLFSWPGEDGRSVHALALGYGSLYNGANPANLRFERDRAAGGEIRFVAAREIARGEELTINYSAADGAVATPADEWFAEHEIRLLRDT